MKPVWRRNGAAVGFFATLILWPVSMFTFAQGEPPTVTSLSWLALTLTLLDIWATTDVRAEQEGNGDGKAEPAEQESDNDRTRRQD